ncbi:carbohydrate ABC transporter permease [Streptomyces rugosispiralis]|uniref:Carbohydrate ABC transporter permease n=1 Tax=Streptomyces rugosispiralis TaxID=2967341 RepID=A0ABT1UNG1_9ACTN|nr:carbohydrate ABC transporter permease [Streptomyces rugosispiralis]MCQ8186677.1 carbohydrate ABC transporter permease [Streptomyces rugosispiralis]
MTAGAQTRVRRLGLTALGALSGFVFLIPIWWLVVAAFRDPTEALSSTSVLGTLIPRSFSLDGFRSAIEDGYLRAVGISLAAAVSTVVGGLVVSSLAAYGFVAVRTRLSKVLFAVVVGSFLLPFETLAVPLVSVFSDLGLANGLPALILPALGNGLAVFNLRQAFLSVPLELAEAQYMDGAGHLRRFWHLYLPLCRPALIGSGMILFVSQWDSYLWPLLIISDNDNATASVAIASNFGPLSSNTQQAFAEVLVLVVIPAILLLFTQRRLIASSATSGIR